MRYYCKDCGTEVSVSEEKWEKFVNAFYGETPLEKRDPNLLKEGLLCPICWNNAEENYQEVAELPVFEIVAEWDSRRRSTTGLNGLVNDEAGT